MILKTDAIAQRLRSGVEEAAVDPLVITPSPDLDELEKKGAASVDLRLGTWFTALRPARLSHLEVDGDTPTTQFARTQYVAFGGEYYLHPRSFVLGVTLEWIRLPSDLSAYVVGRSGWGRRGLIIATATGVHPGFTGCLTLELTNVGEIPISIKPGMTVCQLFIHRVQDSGNPHTDRSQFIGRRKPNFGVVKPDDIAKRLGESRLGGG